MRVKFKKGFQRKFIEEVLNKLGCPSLKELINRGVEINYSSLKNYFCERRLLPLEFFGVLCKLSGVNEKDFSFELIEDNFGQIKGGRISRK